MSSTDPTGSHGLAISHHTVAWAVSEIIRTLGVGEPAGLKVGSGEHLAAILTTAFLHTAPVAVDIDGGPDLVFDLTRRPTNTPMDAALGGRADVRFADFEVKSLPGPFRAFNAALDRATAEGTEPQQTSFVAAFTAANDVLSGDGARMIEQAYRQLERKSGPDRSRNVFLIAHFFDHPVIEVTDAPLLAHHLAPLALPQDIDSVWVLFAPHSLVAWSGVLGRWTNLIYSAVDPGEEPLDGEERLDLLQLIELDFLEQTGTPMNSPYVFELRARTSDDGFSG